MPNPLNLLDKKFVSNLLAKKITTLKSKNINWQALKITPIKKNHSKKNPASFFHFVIRYDIKGLNQPIFCSTHAKENRLGAYNALKLISAKIKGQGITPLFYSKKFKAIFYLGFEGENLQHLIKKNPEKINNVIQKTALWLAQLHQIKTDPQKHNFNPQNSRVKSIIPGPKYYFEKIKKQAPKLFDDFKNIFNQIKSFDEKNYPKNGRYLIHGDLHPENIITNQKTNQTAVVDYTDVCIADFARDLASFSHQLDYMITRFNPATAKDLPKIQNLFLDSYLKNTNLTLTSDIKNRINIYKAWTALRSAIFFLTKDFVEKKEAQKMLLQAQKYLKTIKQ